MYSCVALTEMLRHICSNVLTLVTWSLYFSILLVCIFYVCSRCYVATKCHCSFAASKQHKPFLLRLWWVTNPCIANATTRIIWQYERHTTVVTGFKHGQACKPRKITHRPWNPCGVSRYLYQTGILGTMLLHTLHTTTPLLAVGSTFEWIQVEQQC